MMFFPVSPCNSIPMKTLIILTALLVSVSSSPDLYAQKDPKWDDTSKSKWPPAFEEVSIPSSADGHLQKAYLYKARNPGPRPLIVSLHTWSGDYTQKDPLIAEIAARDWNYIHPDFRGVNNTPDAMGSPKVISDIEDAIRFALEHTHAAPGDVHIIGVSGGGFATLAAYMNLEYPVKSFSAWAPISDLEAWYWESVGRKQRYARDILKATSQDSILNREEALRRSPLVQHYPKERRKDAALYIYEGVHDGYTGSVPITHAIRMYNRLTGELKYGLSDLREIMPKAASDSALVSEAEIIDLVTKRMNPAHSKEESLFGRSIYLSRKYENIRLTIFEGSHEQLSQALALLPAEETFPAKCSILTIGDSNGEAKGGWVDQLKGMMPQAFIFNHSKGGRTIGFDNLGREELNALKNSDRYLDTARAAIGKGAYDYVIVCLGTNDTKKIFEGRESEAVANLEKLLNRVKNHRLNKGRPTRLIYMTPPPMGTTDIGAKYEGGNERLSRLVPQWTAVAERAGFEVIDIYHPLSGVFENYARDGVHMTDAGQKIVAAKIVEKIRESSK